MEYPKKRRERRRNPDGTFVKGKHPLCSWHDSDSDSFCDQPRANATGSYCKAHQAEYARAKRDQYRVHTERCHQRTYQRSDAIIREAKDRPCADCGVQYPAFVMDFDHVRGTKLFTIAQARQRSEVVLLDEIAKCDVVCSNCHRIRTNSRRSMSRWA